MDDGDIYRTRRATVAGICRLFEAGVENTGLVIAAMRRGEYTILASQNPGREIATVLAEASLCFREQGPGTYIVSCCERQVAAVEQAWHQPDAVALVL